MGAQNAETGAATWFCVYGHEHAAIAEAQACDTKWDNAWKGSVCGLHDAGLPMSCTCTPTQSDGKEDATASASDIRPMLDPYKEAQRRRALDRLRDNPQRQDIAERVQLVDEQHWFDGDVS